MTHQFPEDVAAAVLRHMNDDHGDDNTLIARAFIDPSAQGATMIGFDGAGGEWRVRSADGSEESSRVPWPGGPIDARPAVRREVVALYDEACAKLGIAPRPH